MNRTKVAELVAELTAAIASEEEPTLASEISALAEKIAADEGIENEITQDSLSEVLEEAKGEDAKVAAEDKTPSVMELNRPEREDPAMKEYDIDWETINHPYPDMRTEWKNDSRDEIGFGERKMASVKVAANKSVRIATLLLGNKVADELIVAQAEDLMGMPMEAMDRTLTRFSDTKELYASEKLVKEMESSEEEEEVVEAAEEVVAEETPVGVVEEATIAEEVVEEEVVAAEKDEEEVVEAAAKKSDDDEDEEVECEAKKAELDISMEASEDEAVVASEDESAKLAEALLGYTKEGVTTLGGAQPKTASAKKMSEEQSLEAIWSK